MPDMITKRRGRKVGSPIRNNLVELLFYHGEGYGYDLYKKYIRIFGKVTLRSIYYHLSKGAELGVFVAKGTEKVQGDYSWGEHVNRAIFSLGKDSRPLGLPEVKIALEKLKG